MEGNERHVLTSGFPPNAYTAVVEGLLRYRNLMGSLDYSYITVRATSAENDSVWKSRKVVIVDYGQPGNTLRVDQVTAAQGEQAVVTLILTHAGLTRFGTSISYDRTRLRLESVTRLGGALARLRTENWQDKPTANPFRVSLFDMGGANSKQQGDLLSITFTVLPDAPPGEAYVSASIVSSLTYDYQNNRYPINVANGGVTVLQRREE